MIFVFRFRFRYVYTLCLYLFVHIYIGMLFPWYPLCVYIVIYTHIPPHIPMYPHYGWHVGCGKVNDNPSPTSFCSAPGTRPSHGSQPFEELGGGCCSGAGGFRCAAMKSWGNMWNMVILGNMENIWDKWDLHCMINHGRSLSKKSVGW